MNENDQAMLDALEKMKNKLAIRVQMLEKAIKDYCKDCNGVCKLCDINRIKEWK